MLEVRPRLLDGLFVGVRDVDRERPADLLRRRLVAVLLRRLLELAEDAAERVHVGVGLEVGVVVPRGPVDRLVGAERGAPDRRVRLLERPRPRVDVAELEVLAIPLEGAGLRPGLDDQVVRLVEAVARLGRVEREGVVLGADPAHEAGDDAPAGDDVEQRDLLGHPQRMVAQRDRVAEDGDLARRARDEQRGHHVRRGDVPVGGLVVLVDADPVEADALVLAELVEVAQVEVVPLDRVVVGVRDGDPARGAALDPLLGHVRPGHQVEAEELHSEQRSRPFLARSRGLRSCGDSGA